MGLTIEDDVRGLHGWCEESLMDSAVMTLMRQMVAARRSAQARVTERRRQRQN